MNPKEFVHNTAYSVQLPDIAGLSLWNIFFKCYIDYLATDETRLLKQGTKHVRKRLNNFRTVALSVIFRW